MAAVPLVAGGIRWHRVYRDLNEPSQIAAWKEIERKRIPDFSHQEVVVDPNAVRLWLATGRDPNGNDCAGYRAPPWAFDLAFLKPLGVCRRKTSERNPFVQACTFATYSPMGLEAIVLMIEAGADVNQVLDDGSIPLASAVQGHNLPLVKLLVQSGADPDLRPKTSDIGEFRSPREIAQNLPEDPVNDRIRDVIASRNLLKFEQLTRQPAR